MRAVGDYWQNENELDVRGNHYDIDLVVPLFNPGPIDHPEIPIHLAAVNKFMCRVAGEVADGIRPHPVCTSSYIAEVMLPEAQASAQKAGRTLDQFQVAMKPLTASAPTQEEMVPKIRNARTRIAFYASTPSILAELAAQIKAHAAKRHAY